MNLKYSPPLLIQKFFSGFIWETSNNKILLTFDDGPTEDATLKILSVLRSNNIKAIFFCVGNNIMKHQSLAEKIIEDGHTVGNHTLNHKLLTKMSREESIVEIHSFNELMKKKFNYKIKYFRPPHGRFKLTTNHILNEMDLKCVMWNLLTYDFRNRIEEVKSGVDKYLRKNSIAVFHDNIKCSGIIEEALNYTIGFAEKNGYEFGEPENCLK